MRHVLGLDHVVILVRDLDDADARMARLGFRPTPRGHHSAHMGTANATVMLPDRTYFETLTVLQETPANLIQAKLKIEQTEKLRSQLRYLRVEALENGKSMLTAQQRDQLKNLVSSRHPGSKKPQSQSS